MKRARTYAVYFFTFLAAVFVLARQPHGVCAETADAGTDSSPAGNTTQAEPEKLPNPFLTDKEWRYFALQDRNITWTDPNISAIFYSNQSSTVIVSGRVLRVNDFIDGRQITAIRPESVVLKDKKGTYVVKMGSVLPQQQPKIENTK